MYYDICKSQISAGLLACRIHITFDFISFLTALDRDANSSRIPPAIDVSWTGGSVRTYGVNIATEAPNENPLAVPLSNNLATATNLAKDRGPIVLTIAPIDANIRLKLRSYFSSGRQCDLFAATLFVQK